MDARYLQSLFDYNRWANSRVLAASAKLSPEDFVRDLRSSHPSVRDTLVHVMGAEWLWLQRWKGTSPKSLPSAAGFPTLASLKERWAEVEDEQAEFVSGVTEKSLETKIAYVNLQGEPFAYLLWQMMQHAVNHSTYHRGQVATMLRQLGAEPQATDMLIMIDIKSAPAASPPLR
jgi:uncharacterized damage-inducible protein DinB